MQSSPGSLHLHCADTTMITQKRRRGRLSAHRLGIQHQHSPPWSLHRCHELQSRKWYLLVSFFTGEWTWWGMRARPENVSQSWLALYGQVHCLQILQLQACLCKLLILLLKSGDGEIVHYCWENIVRVNFPIITFPSWWGLTSDLWSPNRPLKTPENMSLLKEWFQFVDLKDFKHMLKP